MSELAGPWAGRRAVLATMHGKEAAIAPPLATLGLRVEVARGIDTDSLGTFTGEIPRPGTPLETAIAKARMGMAATGADLGIASEGAYGPDPLVPFLAQGEEWLAAVDAARGLVIAERLVERRPVYDHATAASVAGLRDFLHRVGFPEHGLIVQPNAGTGGARKGLRAQAALDRAVSACAAASADGLALVQTDMRAHMNPTRMATIGRLAGLLAERMLRACPACAALGFGVRRAAPGLPCRWCGAETSLHGGSVMGCTACAHEEIRAEDGAPETADPGYCPACNP